MRFSDRDFVANSFCDFVVGIHLSRLSEDLILFASAEFHFIRISDAYSTGFKLDAAKEKSRRM